MRDVYECRIGHQRGEVLEERCWEHTLPFAHIWFLLKGAEREGMEKRATSLEQGLGVRKQQSCKLC